MDNIKQRALSLMLSGIITAIWLFSISLLQCYIMHDLTAADTFASYGLKMLTVFAIIALSDSLAQIYKERHN